MGFKDTGLIYFLLTLLAATATGTFTIFLLVTYTLARYVTLGGQNILGISELTYTILILFCESKIKQNFYNIHANLSKVL